MKTNGITTPSPKRIAELVREEILNPVRPGNVDSGVPFWNGYSQWFVYAPAFAFPRVEGAAKYRFTVIGDDRVVRAFEADSPSAPLSPVWN